MKHILVINHTRGLHGSEHVLLQSIHGLKKTGYRITVVLPKQVENQGMDEMLDEADTIIRLRYKVAGEHVLRTLAICLYNLPAMFYLCRLIRREQVDTVYSNTSTTVIGIMAAWWTRRKHLWHFHESADSLYGWHNSMNGLYRLLASYRKNTLLYLSQCQRHEWEQAIGQHPASVIYNPVRLLPKAETIPHTGIRFGYLGGFEERKNLPWLLHSFEELHHEYPSTELWLSGARNQQEIDLIKAQTSLQEPTLQVRTHTLSPEEFYSQIDVFVLPSKKEVMPLVAIEAMMAGIAVIQTAESGLGELMTEGKDCLFIQPNEETSLLTAMRHITDETTRKEIARNGQQLVLKANFTEHYIHDLLQLI